MNIKIYDPEDNVIVDSVPRLSMHDYINVLQARFKGVDFGMITRVLCRDRIMLRVTLYQPPIHDEWLPKWLGNCPVPTHLRLSRYDRVVMDDLQQVRRCFRMSFQGLELICEDDAYFVHRM